MNIYFPNEVTTSKKRIFAAALFGLLLGGYIDSASRYTIPRILMIVHKIDLETALSDYDSSIVIGLVVRLAMFLFAACIAGYLSRRKGIVAGLLANSIFILIFAAMLIITIVRGTDVADRAISYQLEISIQLLLSLIGGVFGGWIGERVYSPDNDLDLGNAKRTIFGIRWAHYIWITPFIIYPFLSSAIIVVYAGILCLLADFYTAIHPSLWFNFSWWLYGFVIPMVILGAAWVMVGGFIRFWQIMQYRQTVSKGWKNFGKVLLFGIGAPMLSNILAFFGASVTHNLPRPTAGDWKIGLILALILPIIGILVSIVSWIIKKVRHQY